MHQGVDKESSSLTEFAPIISANIRLPSTAFNGILLIRACEKFILKQETEFLPPPVEILNN
jgi:hypothetical protein